MTDLYKLVFIFVLSNKIKNQSPMYSVESIGYRLTMFTSTFLCETSYSKMKYAKNVYRNRLTDSHLDDLLRVACSNYKPDLSKIVKELSQYQNSH